MSSSLCKWVMEVTAHCGEIWSTSHSICRLRTYETKMSIAQSATDCEKVYSWTRWVNSTADKDEKERSGLFAFYKRSRWIAFEIMNKTDCLSGVSRIYLYHHITVSGFALSSAKTVCTVRQDTIFHCCSVKFIYSKITNLQLLTTL